MIDSLRLGMATVHLVREDDRPRANQIRQSAIFYLSAVVNELEDWRKEHGTELNSFAPLTAAFEAMDSVVVDPWVRAAMGKIRNKFVSHFDSEPFLRMSTGLTDENHTWAEGVGHRLLEDESSLTNLSVALFALDIGTDTSFIRDRTIALLNGAVARAHAFASAGRESLYAHLVSRGAEIQSDSLG
jgi:hypothetical protein